MNALLRIAIPVGILIAVATSVSNSINRIGADMAGKTVRDGIQSQITYHQNTLRDTAICGAYRAQMGEVANAQSASDAGKRLLAISGVARSTDCLK